jgi:hypothetical protein
MTHDRLTDVEVAKVLRRAAELDASPAVPVDDGLPVAAVEAAAAEVGLSPAAVRQAVAELRSGVLDAPQEEPGPSHIVCARVVAGDVETSLAAVGRYLERQAFVRARDRGVEQVWRPREDIAAKVQRRFDFAAAIRLGAVDEVVVRTTPVEGGTLLRLVARLERQVARAPRLAGTAGGVVVGGGVGALGIALGDPTVALAGLPAGALGGTAGWRLGRRARDNQRHRATESIEGLLDELELGRSVGDGGGNTFDRLASRARRLRGGYRV